MSHLSDAQAPDTNLMLMGTGTPVNASALFRRPQSLLKHSSSVVNSLSLGSGPAGPAGQSPCPLKDYGRQGEAKAQVLW